MGTRSTVRFYDEDEVIMTVYQQYDGHIDGVGHALANFLKKKTIVNGFNMGQTMKDGYANGMGCLSAQYVLEKKTEIGGFYLTTKNDKQEYNYEVRFINGEFEISVNDFKGTPDELLDYKEEL